MRRISVIASAAGALLLALTVGATGASADPTLALSRSAAAAGDVVEFSIAGAEDEVSYAVEVAEREVAEGEGVSGAFTMPDLGAAARTVTVRVEVVASDERTTLSRKLEYAPPPPVSSSPSAPAAAAPAPAVAPARPQQAAGSRTASGL